MKNLLALLLIAVSFSAQAQVCRVGWTAPTEFVGNEVLIRDDVASYDLYLAGPNDQNGIVSLSGSSTMYIWESESSYCVACGAVFLKAIYTDNTSSNMSVNACGTNAPVLHGFRAFDQN